MRIVILGAGALGLVVGGLLARAGHDVEIVARGESAAAIREHGLKLSGNLNATVEPSVVESASGRADLLVVAVKTPDTGQALQSVAGLQPGAALSLQNGLTKDALLADAFGPDCVIGAATMIGASRLTPGKVAYTQEGITSIGRLDGSTDAALERVAATWEQAGMPVKVVSDVVVHEWAKQALQAGAAPLAALTRQPTYRLFGLAPLARVFVATVREVDLVAAATGVRISDFDGYGFNVRALCDEPVDLATGQVVARGQAMEQAGTTNVMISMAHDVNARRPSELDQTTGHVLGEARRLGVDAPVLMTLYNAVAGVELAGGARSETPSDR